VAALRSGARYVRHGPAIRRVLTRVLLFVPAASALWALLPLVATDQLDLGSGGYGVLLGSLGIGAVLGALVLPSLRARLGVEVLLTVLFVLYAAALAAVALLRVELATTAVLAVAGLCWMGVLSTMNATAQQVLPGWVRARALSYYLVVFMAGQALGGIVWGLLAGRAGVPAALLVAAGLLVLGAVVARRWPLVDPARLDPTTASYWPEPAFDEPDATEGPVLVIAEYDVPDSLEEDFLVAMQPVSRSRRRTGARTWRLFRDPEVPERYVETFVVATWAEHARQHRGRLTGFDRAAEERVQTLVGAPPRVRHLLAVDLGDRRRR
jgi:MFS family permease